MARLSRRDAPAYVDGPAGLVTEAGTRFRTTEALLRDFAGPVFEIEPLDRLVRRADVWLRAPATLALWVLPASLLVAAPWLAALVALGTYFLGAMLAPAAPGRPLAAALAVLEKPLVQAPAYLVVLTWLGWGGEVAAVVVGLAGFVGFRLGLVPALLRPLTEAIHDRLYPLPAPDQTLRAVIVRSALRHGVALPELQRLERSARETWRVGRKR